MFLLIHRWERVPMCRRSRLLVPDTRRRRPSLREVAAMLVWLLVPVPTLPRLSVRSAVYGV